MRKVNNWAEIKESTGFKRLAPGGYICAIKNVTDVEEKEYLKIEFDIIEGDDKGYFTKQYNDDTRQDKKWPNAGTMYRSYKESALPMFKGFITSVEKSNKNFTWDWDESKLKNKFFGAVIGEEEYLNQKNEKRVRNRVASVHSVETIKNGDFEIPEMKKLDVTKETAKTEDNFIDPFATAVSNNADEVSDTPFSMDEPSPFDNL